jgi:hypothetical protein
MNALRFGVLAHLVERGTEAVRCPERVMVVAAESLIPLLVQVLGEVMAAAGIAAHQEIPGGIAGELTDAGSLLAAW